jgi:hypothetical protein
MSLARDISELAVELLDVWGSAVSLSLFLLSIVIFVLSSLGLLNDPIAEHSREVIDRVCFAGAATAGLVRLVMLIRRLTIKPLVYEDPKTGLPDIDYRDRTGPVFISRLNFGYPKFRFFVPSEEDLGLFVDASNDDPNIAAASGVQKDARRMLYEGWYGVDPKYFLGMERKRDFGDVWETVALSIILQLPEATVSLLRKKKITVVQIRPKHLQIGSGERKTTLLYDTLIFDQTFRNEVSEFKRWHTLFHFAQFAAPTAEVMVDIWIEPDSPILKLSLRKRGKYGRHKTFRLQSSRRLLPQLFGHKVHVFTLPRPQIDNSRLARFIYYWGRIRQEAWDIPVGKNERVFASKSKELPRGPNA